MKSESAINCAAKTLQQTQSLLIISGSGISVESGIPTYRSKQGVYKNPQKMLFFEDLRDNSDKVWQIVHEKRKLIYGKKPNTTHKILSKWEEKSIFKRFLIATQNIDNLHQEAGSTKISEIHGNIWKLSRKKQQSYYESAQFSDEALLVGYAEYRDEILKKWSDENDHIVWFDKNIFETIPPNIEDNIRPHIHFFNEPYGDKLLWIDDFIKNKVDTLLIIGCSGEVNAVHTIIKRTKQINENCTIIDINPNKNKINADIVIKLKASTALNSLNQKLLD